MTRFRKYINEREAENRGVHLTISARIAIGVELAYAPNARNPGVTLVSLCKEKFLINYTMMITRGSLPSCCLRAQRWVERWGHRESGIKGEKITDNETKKKTKTNASKRKKKNETAQEEKWVSGKQQTNSGNMANEKLNNILGKR